MFDSDEAFFSDKEAFRLVTKLSADFVADNVEVIREIEEGFRTHGAPPLVTRIINVCVWTGELHTTSGYWT
jgi:hypothetical protein